MFIATRLLLTLFLTSAVATGQETQPTSATPDEPAPEELPSEIRLEEFLVMPRVGVYGRQVVHQDPIDAAIARGDWQPPEAGDKLAPAPGSKTPPASAVWRPAKVGDDGRLTVNATRGGYAYATVESPVERTMLLDAQRHAAVNVNGQWHAGDPYGLGFLKLPVKLKKGTNHLLFHVAQPGFEARLVAPSAEMMLLADDATLPDLPADSEKIWASVPLVNATEKPLLGATLRATVVGDEGELAAPVLSPLPTIEGMSVYKAPLRFMPPEGTEQNVSLRVELLYAGDERAKASVTLPLRVAEPGSPRTHTFVSRIDGSVQPYSVIPASEEELTDEQPGIIVALHGLGVDHAKHAEYFTPKPWAHIIVPQNRRAFGFDWEDWGATDAIEALDDAQRRLEHDERRIYLTGHSMGGHGVLRIATRYPDRFAAIGASAAWISQPQELDESAWGPAKLLAQQQPDTLAMLRNLSHVGVYLLHGADDNKVSPEQSRFIRSRLGEFHRDFVYHERPGAGHWWGTDCVDWPAMMDFFKSRRIPLARDIERVDFTTNDPGESAESHWVTVVTQQTPFKESRLVVDFDRERTRFSGRTENVRSVEFDLSSLPAGKRVSVRLDDSPSVTLDRRGRRKRLLLVRNEKGRWQESRRPPAGDKSPRRSGGFKPTFGSQVALIYGTGGTDEENAWAKAKARFDAHTFYYRANGAVQVMPDSQFNAVRQPNRNVVLYGNAQTNSAWPTLMSTSPVQVRQGEINIGPRVERDDDLGAILVRPRPSSTVATVATVGGTGLAGMRLTNRLPWFVSGVAYPDLLIFDPIAVSDGVTQGVRAAGDFGHDWRLDEGEFAWRELAL